MEKYDYFKAVAEDVRNYISEADTLCRCYMLDAAITIVLDELEKAGAFSREEAGPHAA